MQIRQILSRRNKKNQNYSQPIIYEWEDEISKELGISIKNYSRIYSVVNHFDLHIPFVGPINNTFRFVVNGKDYDEPMNNNHIIPCIIDFFEKKEHLNQFYKKHNRNKLILLSSPFDYHYLKDNNCPLNIGLFPYSLADKWAINGDKIQKKYDIVLTGRQDPLLYSFFKEYVKKHPDVTYVKRGQDIENDNKKTKGYYLNGKDYIGEVETREDFMYLQAQGRATLYGVQGYLDGFTRGFYHMTPHFLEIIACGSHVLAHYPTGDEGVDANFYEFEKFSPSIETYEQFEAIMDKALNTDVDLEMYSNYLAKHYTSVRAKELKKLIENI